VGAGGCTAAWAGGRRRGRRPAARKRTAVCSWGSSAGGGAAARADGRLDGGRGDGWTTGAGGWPTGAGGFLLTCCSLVPSPPCSLHRPPRPASSRRASGCLLPSSPQASSYPSSWWPVGEPSPVARAAYAPPRVSRRLHIVVCVSRAPRMVAILTTPTSRLGCVSGGWPALLQPAILHQFVGLLQASLPHGLKH
jgi:hypothetical protein